jgi:N-acetylmuramoyl-L-alanine amidase
MRWINLRAGYWAGICLILPMLLTGQAAQTPPPAAQTQAMPPVPVPPAAGAQVVPRFLVLLDAAHGGSDAGARLTPTLLEKDLTLDLTDRLRSMLTARGVTITTTRDSDITLPADSRAEVANRTSFAACILIHATATGSGVHLYTSSLAPTPLVKFMPWQTAQSAYVTQSLKLSSDIDSALAHAEIPVTLGRTSLQPMDSFACPAVAVEIAPLQAGSSTKASPITDTTYQRTILDALAAAIDEWHNDWRQQP